MINVNEIDGTIECYAGNSGYVNIAPLGTDDEPYFLEDGEKIIFTVAAGSHVYIQKILTKDNQDEDGIISLFISHNDTKNMVSAQYKYDCLFISPQKDQYDTFIEPSRFTVKLSPSRVGDE